MLVGVANDADEHVIVANGQINGNLNTLPLDCYLDGAGVELVEDIELDFELEGTQCLG